MQTIYIKTNHPNELSKLIEEQKIEEKINLTISGHIASRDIVAIRKLAGGATQFRNFNKVQLIHDLDLTDAIIVYSEDVYFETYSTLTSDGYYHTVEGAITPFMFTDLKDINKIILPKTINRICRNAFFKCEVKEVIFHTIEEIEELAFSHSTIETIEIDSKKVGSRIFESCYKLRNVHFGSNIESMRAPFGNQNKSIEKITLDASNDNFIIEGDSLYNAKKTRLIAHIQKNGEVEYTVPDGILYISSGALVGSPILTKINLPQGLKQIGRWVFANSLIEEVHFPSSITSMSESSLCGGLKDAYFYSSISPRATKSLIVDSTNGCSLKSMCKIHIPHGCFPSYKEGFGSSIIEESYEPIGEMANPNIKEVKNRAFYDNLCAEIDKMDFNHIYDLNTQLMGGRYNGWEFENIWERDLAYIKWMIKRGKIDFENSIFDKLISRHIVKKKTINNLRELYHKTRDGMGFSSSENPNSYESLLRIILNDPMLTVNPYELTDEEIVDAAVLRSKTFEPNEDSFLNRLKHLCIICTIKSTKHHYFLKPRCKSGKTKGFKIHRSDYWDFGSFVEHTPYRGLLENSIEDATFIDEHGCEAIDNIIIEDNINPDKRQEYWRSGNLHVVAMYSIRGFYEGKLCYRYRLAQIDHHDNYSYAKYLREYLLQSQQAVLGHILFEPSTIWEVGIPFDSAVFEQHRKEFEELFVEKTILLMQKGLDSFLKSNLCCEQIEQRIETMSKCLQQELGTPNNVVASSLDDLKKQFETNSFTKFTNLIYKGEVNNEAITYLRYIILGGEAIDLAICSNLRRSSKEHFFKNLEQMNNYTKNTGFVSLDLSEVYIYIDGVFDLSGCRNLISLKLSAYDNRLHTHCLLKGCCNLTSLEIKSNTHDYVCTDLMDNALAGCVSLREINGVRLKAIGNNAFIWCGKINNLTLYSDMKFEPNAFRNTKIEFTTVDNGQGFSYTNHSLPPNKAIKTLIFSGKEFVNIYRDCLGLRNIVCNNQDFKIVAGALYNKDMSNLYLVNKTITHFVIPESVKNIDHYAFTNCSYLEELVLQSDIQRLGNLEGCYALKRILFPNNNSGIAGSFENCFHLENVTLSNDVKGIVRMCFRGCKNLQQVVLPEGIEEIGFKSFYGCSSLKYVKFPSTLCGILSGAFMGCKSIEELVFPKQCAYIAQKAFVGCDNIKRIIIMSELPTINNNSKDVYKLSTIDQSSLEEVYIPNAAPQDVNSLPPCPFINPTKVTLYVNKEYVNVFSLADGWKETNICECPEII